MKTRIEILVATFAFIIGASGASWSQSQAASQTPRQRVAGNHSKTDHSKSNDVTAQTPASGATRTSQETKAKTGTADRIDVIGHLALPGATVTNLRTTEDSSLHMLEVTDSATG